MSTIILCGKAGVGKDAVAKILSEEFDAVTIAQSAPMKEFVGKTFGFSWEQLWGPSAARNAVDPRLRTESVRSLVAERISEHGPEWVRDVLPTGDTFLAFKALCDWAGAVLDCDQITPRHVLQTLGTEWGRTQGHPDMWSRYALDKAHAALVEGAPMACIVDGRFRNEVLNARASGALAVRISAQVPGIGGHASEREIDGMPSHWFAAEIKNDRAQGLDALRHTVTLMVRHLCPPGGIFHV